MPEKRSCLVTSQDWERHRTRITSLYALHTLPELMQIMRDEHQFVASLMMYKKHLRKWGVQKNLRSDQVIEALRKPHKHQLSGLSSLHTGLVDQGRIRVYLSRVSESRRHQIIMAIYDGSLREHSTPSPNLVMIKPTATERYFYHIQDYVTGTFGSGAWSKIWTSEPSLYGKNFESIDLALTAKNAFVQGHMREAFRIIDFSFERLKYCMELQTADILTDFHCSALISYSFCPELAHKWAIYIGDLSRMIYDSDSRPRYITTWIEQIRRLSLEDWIHLSLRVINLYIKTLSDHMDTGSTLNSNIVRAGAMLLSRFRGTKVAVISQNELASMGRLTFDGFGRTNLADPFAKFTFASVLFDERKYNEAQQLAMEILQSNQIEKYREVTGFCYRLLFLIAKKTGKPEDAMLAAQQSTSFCRAHLGFDNELTTDAFNDMQEELCSRGEAIEAEDCRQLASGILNRMCDRLDRLALAMNRTSDTNDAHDTLGRSSQILASNILETWRQGIKSLSVNHD
ncbi:uncharacterized protein BCR38DRAFT_418149 [Pseudomassariella vexata]|uniref:Clr5 domain-containing protein n=1 Tax=Pseudomassariella vexata TaxID=1141098 RepID=A0A1Y2EJX6_9PEZI|nr:uncharacterized protein BCR38DRAFT_418149 [Pseudomassariella vexata]ORY71817.1 hypothetical protein BCR38DRAFT_418149 [Pseudomassariella vexata]